MMKSSLWLIGLGLLVGCGTGPGSAPLGSSSDESTSPNAPPGNPNAPPSGPGTPGGGAQGGGGGAGNAGGSGGGGGVGNQGGTGGGPGGDCQQACEKAKECGFVSGDCGALCSSEPPSQSEIDCILNNSCQAIPDACFGTGTGGTGGGGTGGSGGGTGGSTGACNTADQCSGCTDVCEACICQVTLQGGDPNTICSEVCAG